MLLAFHILTRNTRINILVLSSFRGALTCLPPLAVVSVLLGQHLFRRDSWDIRLRVLGGMLVESVLWVIPLMALSHVTELVFLTAAGPATQPSTAGVLDSMLIGMGGGLYEEFVFHLLAIGIIMLIFVDGMSIPRIPAAILAVAATAVVFAFFHTDVGPFSGGDPFSAKDFAFRAAAGLYLGALFITRGFGIAVGAHVAWNVYIFVM